MAGRAIDGVTIGRAAAFAGVTVKTVRHYQEHGVIDEPRRDGSGYRRYGSADLLRLVQARTLAVAGVPLAEIRALLDADAERLAGALVDVERRLTERIEEMVARRDTLRRLADGDRALLPDRACALLDRLAGLGFPPGAVAGRREDLVLARALFPGHFDRYLDLLERRLDDAGFTALEVRCWEAGAWDPADPRVEELAAAMAAHLLAHPVLMEVPGGLPVSRDVAARYGMLNEHGHERAPAWARLTALVESRLRAAGVPIPG